MSKLLTGRETNQVMFGVRIRINSFYIKFRAQETQSNNGVKLKFVKWRWWWVVGRRLGEGRPFTSLTHGVAVFVLSHQLLSLNRRCAECV